MNWVLSEQGYSAEAVADTGNRFLIGNGYLGVRGTLEEDSKQQLAAVNLAGIFDRVGDGWREPLNAPNPFYTTVKAGGLQLHPARLLPVEHLRALNYRAGIVTRKTLWRLPQGGIVVQSERFVSMANPHFMGMRYTITAHSDMQAELFAGIDADVWDINGPHYSEVLFSQQDGMTICAAFTRQKEKAVAVARRDFFASAGRFEAEPLCAGNRWTVALKAGQHAELISLCSVHTTNDTGDPVSAAAAALAGLDVSSYKRELQKSRSTWETIWRCSEVRIEGDAQAERAINYSLYHLGCIAPRGGKALSVAARGLSGQTYKGAVFWDSEMFMLDYYLFTQPSVAKSLIRYRIDTLSGALEKASQYGWQGAFYAWESQEGGIDACSDYNVIDVFTGRPVRTYFRDKQVHISAAVVWAIRRYVEHTGDEALLSEGGIRVILECARFYWSLLVKPLPQKLYELHDVIGPDEYHERVNNNAYTNYMAMFTFDTALEFSAQMQNKHPAAWKLVSQDTEAQTLLANIQDAKEHLYLPGPGPDGVIEQFDGYFKLENADLNTVRARIKDPREYWGGGSGVASDTQIIKQADVVTMLELFHEQYDKQILRANWLYYEPRTEHGSSLSACMYALLACRFARPDLAYPFFMKSATAEIKGGGKQWAGLVYIGGTHPAAAGGAWKTLAQGFGGVHLTAGGEVALTPCLPEHWQRLTFRFVHGGRLLCADITREKAKIILVDEQEAQS